MTRSEPEDPNFTLPETISLAEAASLFRHSTSSFYRWRHDPHFPKPDARRRYDLFKINAYDDLLALEKMDATEFHELELARAASMEELLNSGQLAGLERNVRKVIFKIRRADPETARLEAIADLEAQVRGV